MMAEAVTIFTVGHGARTLDAFLELLRRPGIERLVDVRTAPGSRKHPHFGQGPLSEALWNEGISYVWRKDLGGWRTARPASPHTAIRSDSFRGYADYMETEEFARATDWLIQTSKAVPTTAMCAEAVWWRCHRRMLADSLLVRGCTVVHLVEGGRREPHRLHPNARVEPETARIVYDVEDQPPLPMEG
jgi:uncharacterized protein (DUF488 family)